MNDEKPLTEQVADLQKELAEIKEGPAKPVKQPKQFTIRIPTKIKSSTKKDTKKVAVILLGDNRRVRVEQGVERDGLWYVGPKDKEQQFGYEEQAVFYYQNTPCIIVFEWRLLPVGGQAEEAMNAVIANNGEVYKRIVGGKEDEMLAEIAGIKTFGQKTIIRGIKQAELDKDQKKPGGGGWILWALAGVAVIFFITQYFKGG